MSLAKKRKEGSLDAPMESRAEDRGLSCSCGMPEDSYQLIAQCDLCARMYHPVCIGVDDDVTNQAKWHCPNCIDKMEENRFYISYIKDFQGRVPPSKGWNDEFPVEDIDERVILEKVENKRVRNEGWTLYRKGRITSLSSNKLLSSIYFRSQCQAAVKHHSYIVYICLKDEGLRLKWSTCSCPTGMDGNCEHVVACLYKIIEMNREGLPKIPSDMTCTEKLEMWHVKKPMNNEPLMLSDIEFVTSDPKNTKERDQIHNPVPDVCKPVTENRLRNFVASMEAAGIHLPILETIRANDFAPKMPKERLGAKYQRELFDMMQNSRHNVASSLKPDAINVDNNVQRFYYSAVHIDLDGSKFIERKTSMQGKTPFLFEEKQYRLTASMFGTFCRMKPTTDPVEVFCQRRFFKTKSVQHRIHYEGQALAKYVEQQSVQTYGNVGIIIHPDIPFLAASPDVVVKVDGEFRLVEIKCPYSLFQKKIKIKDQLQESSFYLHQENDEIKLKITHDHYFEIQGQLNITKVNQCDLVVFVPPRDIVVVNIKRDQNFFKTVMLPKLHAVYFEKLLPHFVSELVSEHV